jgi:hypothetical protein
MQVTGLPSSVNGVPSHVRSPGFSMMTTSATLRPWGSSPIIT